MKKNDSTTNVLDSYVIDYDGLLANVSIVKREGDNVKTYILDSPKFNPATSGFVEDIKTNLLKKISISAQEALNIKLKYTVIS